MAKKLFSDEEMQALEKNPYVVMVLPSQVSFSSEFKSIFYAKYKDGMNPEDIIHEAGIDPKVLGKTRIAGLRQTILKSAREGKTFTDARTSSLTNPMFKSDAETIAYLRHELAYMKQENEFLKKIVSVGQTEEK